MARYIRNTVLLAKVETTEGTDVTPTGSSNALLVSNVTVNPLVANNVNRDLVRNYFGASEQLVGTAYVEITFTVELQGSGTAATAPKWGELMRGCGFVESGLVSYAQYVPDVPASQKSMTLYYYDDGAQHKLLGAKGDITAIDMSIGARPTITFKFLGKDGGVSAVSNPATTLTGWKTPLVINDTNTGDVTLGGSYSAGAITGGTAYTSSGLKLALGNQLDYTPLLGGDYIDISGREVTGSVEFDLTVANEVTFAASLKANTLQTLSLVHGATTGYIVGVSLAAAQFINWKKSAINGRRLIGYDIRSVPSAAAGNDDLTIWTK